jgi:hypothetical protein
MNLGNLLVMLVVVTIVTVALDSLLFSQPVHLYWRISSAFMWSVIVRAAIEQITK